MPALTFDQTFSMEDVNELKSLLSKAHQPRVQMFLKNAIDSSTAMLEQIAPAADILSGEQTQMDVDNLTSETMTKDTTSTHLSPKPPIQQPQSQDTTTSTTTRQRVEIIKHVKPITEYSWSETNTTMTLYVSIPPRVNVNMTDEGQILIEGEVPQLKCGDRWFELDVSGGGRVVYRVRFSNLAGEIDEGKSGVKVKKDKIVINLGKVKSGAWGSLVKKAEKRAPKMDKDPESSLMDMIKQMYEDGDDEMKRMIAKTWTENRDKKGNRGLGGVDFESRPLLAFYSCYLPDPKTADYDVLLQLITIRLDAFVENDYVVVLFAGGSKHQPSWAWLFKAYSKLSRKYRKNLKNLYVVHTSMFFKLLMQMMAPLISPKFSRKLVWVASLEKLSALVPMQNLPIPQVVLEVDNRVGTTSQPTSPTTTHSTIATPWSPNMSTNQNLPPVASRSKPPGAGPVDPAILAKKQFTVPVEMLMGSDCSKGLPRVVVDCVTFIRAKGMFTEGIFRRSPSSQALQHTKEMYDNNKEKIDLEAMGGVHLACVLLKLFFRELPVPVFEPGMYDVIKKIEAVSGGTENQAKFAASTLLPLLSKPKYLLVRYVFRLLKEVDSHSGRNLMTAHNLAIVWSPNMVRGDNPMVDFAMCAVGGGAPSQSVSGTSNAGPSGGLPPGIGLPAGGAGSMQSGGVGTLVKVAIMHWDLVFPEGEPMWADDVEISVEDQNVEAHPTATSGTLSPKRSLSPVRGTATVRTTRTSLGVDGADELPRALVQAPLSPTLGGGHPGLLGGSRMGSVNTVNGESKRRSIIGVDDSALDVLTKGLADTTLASASRRVSAEVPPVGRPRSPSPTKQ
ncbi:hypothetical protein HDU76_005866 [Blyttiomyces sp. JEL0837]|nr:hypothetical protein HDU76_005866 [Blyttiomyces sp. JEL0837]